MEYERTDRTGRVFRAGDIFFRASTFNAQLLMLRQTEKGLYADYEEHGVIRTAYFDETVERAEDARMPRTQIIGNVFEDPKMVYLFAGVKWPPRDRHVDANAIRDWKRSNIVL